MKIEDAIQQAQFLDIFHKTHLNVLYTASFISQQSGLALKPHGISMQQFNILRILRGLKNKPATIKVLTERMIDKTSNASRLVDKLLSKGLVDRKECPTDRRRVDVFITQKGLDLLDLATRDMDTMIRDYWKDLSKEEAELLSEMLDRVRISHHS